MQLDSVVAIVTGGSQGIGKALVHSLCQAGGYVLVVDVDSSAGEKLIEEFHPLFGSDHLIFLHGNVADSKVLAEAFTAAEKFSGQVVNTLINNAGIFGDYAFIQDPNNALWSDVVDVNFKAVVRGTQIAFDRMKKAPFGSGIINIASMAAFMPLSVSPVYAATKAAICAFTTSCAQHAAASNLRINAVCPMLVETNMGLHAKALFQQYHHTTEIPGGILPPERVKDAVLQIIQQDQYNGEQLCVTQEGITRRTNDNVLA